MRNKKDNQKNSKPVPSLLATGRDTALAGGILERQRIAGAACVSMQTMLDDLSKEYGPFVRHIFEKLMSTNQKLRSRTELLKTLSLQLTHAENQERKRIAQLLHDDLQQMLASAKLQTDMLFDDVDREIAPRVQTIYDILSKAMATARSLSHELNPDFATNGEFSEALNGLMARMADAYGFEVQTAIALDNERMVEEVQIFIYRSIQELLLNCAKHAGATHVSLEANRRGTFVELAVTDDGAGFEPEGLSIFGGAEDGCGLFNIKERATALGGSFEIHSAPGMGCRIVLTLPADPHDVTVDDAYDWDACGAGRRSESSDCKSQA
jgi:signal transduction histidine kinase